MDITYITVDEWARIMNERTPRPMNSKQRKQHAKHLERKWGEQARQIHIRQKLKGERAESLDSIARTLERKANDRQKAIQSARQAIQASKRLAQTRRDHTHRL